MAKILIIEDDESYIENIATLLSEEKYTVIKTLSGFDGLDKAKTENPDLVICDIMMPDISGHTVLKEIRKRDSTKFLPLRVLLLLASTRCLSHRRSSLCPYLSSVGMHNLLPFRLSSSR